MWVEKTWPKFWRYRKTLQSHSPGGIKRRVKQWTVFWRIKWEHTHVHTHAHETVTTEQTTHLQSLSFSHLPLETLDWKKHKRNQDCQEKYQSLQICRWHHPYGRKWRGAKKPLDESEGLEWKSWLKAQHSENKDHGIWPHHFMGNRWGNSGNSVRLYFLGLQNHCRWWLQPWN